MSLNILYLAHDISDPAIRRRVLMLRAGGARVSVVGFVRDENRLAGEANVELVVLGQTSDGRLGQRIAAVVNARFKLRQLLSGLSKPDIIIARNLEMLALSNAVSHHFGRVPIAYECLDIHRLLLDRGLKGRLVRAAEAHFGKAASLLMTSSPAFVSHYFEPISSLNLPVLLVENKVLELTEPSNQRRGARLPTVGEPWRIGWFGAIRCRKSFEILSRLTASMAGQVEVIIRGRVSPKEFPDFEQLIGASSHISFLGTYRNPEDLAEIYDQVQFVWAIDFFEEGLNSEWLLPNRLYEGALHGAVPIALGGTETGRFLKARGLGLLLDSAAPRALQARIEGLQLADYFSMSTALAQTDRAQWAIDQEGCESFVQFLSDVRLSSI